MDKHLCWEPKYSFEKIFTLSTRWQLLHLPDLTLAERSRLPNLFIPDRILKVRNIRSIASYEIIWRNEHGATELLRKYREERARENDDNNADDNVLASIEPQDLVLKCYPDLVGPFEDVRSKKSQSKKRTANSRKKQPLREITNLEGSNDNNEAIRHVAKAQKLAATKPGRKKTVAGKSNKKMDEFLSSNPLASLEQSFEEMAIAPKRSRRRQSASSESNEIGTHDASAGYSRRVKRGPQFERVLLAEGVTSGLNNTIDKMFDDLAPDDFVSDNEDNDPNMTNVIEDICNKRAYRLTVEKCRRCTESTERFVDNDPDAKLDEPLTLNRERCIDIDADEKTDDFGDDEFGDISECYIPINQRVEMRRENRKRVQKTCNQIKEGSSCDFENIMSETNNDSITVSDKDTTLH